MFKIILLAIIQGVSEFLPISSSAHLIIFRDVFSIGSDIITSDIELTFDIALHFGTALAIVCMFFKDFLNMFLGVFNKNREDGKLFWFIIVATIPAAVVGFLFEDIIENIIRTKYFVVSLALILMGIIIYLADKYSSNEKNLKSITIVDSFLIGCSQVFALIPGFSRSGTTIATSRLLKINREDATKFSFYLSAPIVIGAVVLQLFKIDYVIIRANLSIFLIGILSSFIVGLFSINFLLKYIKKNDFKIFMWYRLILGIFVILYLISV